MRTGGDRQARHSIALKSKEKNEGMVEAPPYNVDKPSEPNARMIRAAMDEVARSLDLPADVVIPVALGPAAKPYNIDALWARLSLELSEAQLVQLDRLRLVNGGLSLREVAAQIISGGRWAIAAIVKG
jgi:hypothetical protein